METKTISGKIAQARKKAGMSQASLAQLLFISPQAVGKWERGESIPDILTFQRLAEILSVDLNYFSENMESSENELEYKPTTARTTESEQTIQDNAKPSPQRELLMNFSGSALAQTDFSGITAHNRKFNGSNLCRADFSGADLTGSSFKASDIREANFNGTNLTDCTLYANNLIEASFNKTIFIRTVFSASDLAGAKFSDAKLIDVKLTSTDLRNTVFERCCFSGVDFKSSDLSGLCFEGQSFIDVKFDNGTLNEASFKGATFKNVSFRPTFAITNRYYKTLKTICFDGAMMDKLTFAALKGVGVNLLNVTII